MSLPREDFTFNVRTKIQVLSLQSKGSELIPSGFTNESELPEVLTASPLASIDSIIRMMSCIESTPSTLPSSPCDFIEI